MRLKIVAETSADVIISLGWEINIKFDGKGDFRAFIDMLELNQIDNLRIHRDL